jgi:hypothetical protein
MVLPSFELLRGRVVEGERVGTTVNQATDFLGERRWMIGLIDSVEIVSIGTGVTRIAPERQRVGAARVRGLRGRTNVAVRHREAVVVFKDERITVREIGVGAGNGPTVRSRSGVIGVLAPGRAGSV